MGYVVQCSLLGVDVVESGHVLQAIQGYKETEKRQWNEDNIAVMERLKSAVESATVDRPAVRTLHEVHVLDLAHDG